MKYLIRLSVVLFALLCTRAFAQQYNIRDLGALLGPNSYAHGINNDGQVVGYWISTNGARAFLYSAGSVTDLGTLGGTNNYALSINSSGQIVGFGEETNGTRAFLYNSGSITNLGPLGGVNSYAYGINDNGQIVGYIDTTNGARAFIYGDGGVTNLGTLGGTNSFGFGVNNSNLVVGSSSTAAEAKHAFLWQNGVITNLNDAVPAGSGWELNDARGINNSGKIVGWGVTNGQEQAFLYSNGQITKIGVLAGGTNSFAFGINNSNAIVGASTLTNGLTKAFVWKNGNLTNLDQLLPPNFNWDLREARGINDRGEIVGWGVTNGQEHAFLLSPNTPPSVAVTNPANNAVLAGPLTINIGASASDVDGNVAKVEFYSSATKLGEDASEPYGFAWLNVGEGTYSVKAVAFDNSSATSTSTVVNVTVAIPPSIGVHPVSQRIVTSSNVTFTVTASGTVPLSYQWRFNGANIGGATRSSYSITNVQTAHAGIYSVLITNIVGSVTSDNALLTVVPDPKNLGKGDWIYMVSAATNKLGGNVPGVTDVATLMTYERSQGMQFVVVKAGDGATFWTQFNSALVDAAHAAGLKIFAYGRIYGTNVAGEISVATNAIALGADGFVIDAEIEYESQNLANNAVAAEDYCDAIRSAYPNVFLAYSPFVFISSHSTFPYVVFGKYCDAVMPQCYWKSFGISVSSMVSQLNTEWRNWQNSLTGTDTNAIKPIAPVAQGWSPSPTSTTTGAEIAEFVSRLKSSSNPATAGGYKGVSFWRGDLHSPDMWTGISSASIGNPNGSPAIVMQPVGLTVNAGDNATFSVQAVGAGTLGYQWRLNGVSISGATASSYTRSSVQSSHAGVYSVLVTNAYGGVLSTDALLTLASYSQWLETFESGVGSWTAVGSLLTNSSAQNHTTSGTNSAKVSNTLNRTYRNIGAEIGGNSKVTFWIYDSTQTRAYGEVRAHTGSGYSSTGFTQILGIGRFGSSFGSTQAGSLLNETVDTSKYQGRVYAGANTGWCNLNASGCPGRSTGWHKFEIERLADGTTINFYVDGVLGRTITDATSQTWDAVTIGSVAAGSTTGDAWFDDINVEYFGTPTISTPPTSQTVAVGSNVTFTVTATGTISSYQWRFNGTNIAGATTSTLVLNNVTSANAGEYTVVIRNSLGATVSSAATLAVVPPTTIVTQPLSQSVPAGTNVTFSVIVDGVAPFTYQWRKNGSNLTDGGNISGSSTEQLTISSVSEADINNYDVTISNIAGVVVSAKAVLYVGGVAIFFDDFESGTLANWTTVSSGTPMTLSSNKANPVNGLYSAKETNSLNKMYHNLGTEVQNRARASFWIYDNGDSHIRAYGEARSHSGNGYANGSLQQIFAVGIYQTPFDPNTGELLGEDVNSTYYQARVYAGTNTGWCNLNATNVPVRSIGWHKFDIEKSSDGRSVKFFVDGVLGRTITNTVNATWDTVATGSYGSGSGADYDTAWFDDIKVEYLDAPIIVTQPNNLTNNQGTTATFTVVATGNNLSYQWKRNGNNIFGATTSSLSLLNVFPSESVWSYTVAVSNPAGTTVSDAATLTVIVPPTIVTQPFNRVKNQGQWTTIGIGVAGTYPMTYQWKKNGVPLANGGNVSGADTLNLRIDNITLADEGTYQATVSNPAGTATSQTATLTVIVPPSITTQPASQTVDQGTTATLSVVATGTNPFYQWKKNGSNLLDSGNVAGATTATLSLANLSQSDAATYSVFISNSAGSISSDDAVLTIVTPPVIVAQPAESNVKVGENAVFEVQATSIAPLTYQWERNGTMIEGATTDHLIITEAAMKDYGAYSVRVQNSAGQTVSASADLGLIGGLAVASGYFGPTMGNQALLNYFGQTAVPAGLNNATFVDAGGNSSLAIRDDKTFQRWGFNYDFIGSIPPPANLVHIIAASVGSAHTLAVTEEGNVVGWGANDVNQCNPPVYLDNNAIDVMVSGASSFALTKDGKIIGWGGNTSGEIDVPNSVANVKTMFAGEGVVGAIDYDGNVMTWGAGGNPDSLVPSGLTDVKTIAVGFGCTMIVKRDGALLVTRGNNAQKNVPAGLAGKEVISVAIGEDRCFALTSDKVVWSWGDTTGAMPSELGGVATISAGRFHFLALTYGPTIRNALANITGTSLRGWQFGDASPSDPKLIPFVRYAAYGSSVTLSVTASGAAPLNYQWTKNGVPLSDSASIVGSTTATLTLLGMSDTMDGDYTVRVSNSEGFIGTIPYILHLIPSIITQPVHVTQVAGATATFEVVATGPVPVSYQWKKNGVLLADGGNISGATTSRLTVTSLSGSDYGNYNVFVNTAAGPLVSGSALLRVLSAPIINSSAVGIPTEVSFTASGFDTIETTPTPEDPLAYANIHYSFDGGATWSEWDGVPLTVDRIASITAYSTYGSLISSKANACFGTPERLGYWRFNTVGFVGEQGETPVTVTGTESVTSWSGNAVQIQNTNPAKLVYKAIETSGKANLQLPSGSIRFWFKPSWDGGTGPENVVRLVQLGEDDAISEWWTISVDQTGEHLIFEVGDGNNNQTCISCSVASWSAGYWHQIALTYSSYETRFYIDGELKASGEGISIDTSQWDLSSVGFSIGSNLSGEQQAKGDFDELETFNYELMPQEISSQYLSMTTAKGVHVRFPSTYTSLSTASPIITGGPTATMAILIDPSASDFDNATWVPFESSPSVSLGAGDGHRDVWFGFRSVELTEAFTYWSKVPIIVDTAPPSIAPVSQIFNVTSPLLQLNGACNEAVASVTYDLVNSGGQVSGQRGFITQESYDRNTLVTTMAQFSCYDLHLEPGANIITLHVTDKAGNTAAATYTYQLNTAQDSMSPIINVDFPKNNMALGGEAFELLGHVDDGATTVSATVVSDNNIPVSRNAVVSRDGKFRVKDLPLSGSSAVVTVNATDAAGNIATATLNVLKSALKIKVDPIPQSQLRLAKIRVTGTINSSSHHIIVNGITASPPYQQDGLDPTLYHWTAVNVPVARSSSIELSVEAWANGGGQ